ncbi:uncharacterized protein [Penaeus vannamei]|uniref:uncharacterized protein n=1 Tax=Penaeus vannamei TaxID=6689 RepID=UPI00387F8F94
MHELAQSISPKGNGEQTLPQGAEAALVPPVEGGALVQFARQPRDHSVVCVHSALLHLGHDHVHQALDVSVDLVHNILRRTRLLLSLLEDYVDFYAQEKFSNSWAVMDAIFSPEVDAQLVLVCDQELECDQVLPRLPSPPSTSPQPEELLQQLLTLSRRYALALELVFLDQSLHEDELDLLERTDQIYRHVQGLVDVIVAQVEKCRVDADDAVVTRLAGKLYKGASSDGRNQRGFRTLRQCLLGLRYIRSLL